MYTKASPAISKRVSSVPDAAFLTFDTHQQSVLAAVNQTRKPQTPWKNKHDTILIFPGCFPSDCAGRYIATCIGKLQSGQALYAYLGDWTAYVALALILMQNAYIRTCLPQDCT